MLGLLLNSLDSIWSMLLRTFLSKNEQPWNVGTTTDYWKITPLSILSIFFFFFWRTSMERTIFSNSRWVVPLFPFFCGEIKFQYLNLWQFVEQKRIPLLGSRKSKNLSSSNMDFKNKLSSLDIEIHWRILDLQKEKCVINYLKFKLTKKLSFSERTINWLEWKILRLFVFSLKVKNKWKMTWLMSVNPSFWTSAKGKRFTTISRKL